MKVLKSLAATLLLTLLLVDCANAGYTDPGQFWTTFRQAVLDNDINTIVKLTHFPFKTRGPFDSSPVTSYNSKRFPEVYEKLIAQKELLPAEGKIVSTTMFELIKKKKTITHKDFNTSDSLWIHDFVFTRKNGSWFFTFGYLND
jgi:hypothetical protein